MDSSLLELYSSASVHIFESVLPTRICSHFYASRRMEHDFLLLSCSSS